MRTSQLSENYEASPAAQNKQELSLSRATKYAAIISYCTWGALLADGVEPLLDRCLSSTSDCSTVSRNSRRLPQHQSRIKLMLKIENKKKQSSIFDRNHHLGVTSIFHAQHRLTPICPYAVTSLHSSSVSCSQVFPHI